MFVMFDAHKVRTKIKPVFEESYLQHKDTKYARVDCEANDRLCYEYQIDGYPTFYYFGNSLDEVVSYAGPRSVEEFDTFISAQVTERVDDPIKNIDLKSLRLGQVKGLIQELGIACNDCKSHADYVAFLQEFKDARMHKLMQIKRG